MWRRLGRYFDLYFDLYNDDNKWSAGEWSGGDISSGQGLELHEQVEDAHSVHRFPSSAIGQWLALFAGVLIQPFFSDVPSHSPMEMGWSFRMGTVCCHHVRPDFSSSL